MLGVEEVVVRKLRDARRSTCPISPSSSGAARGSCAPRADATATDLFRPSTTSSTVARRAPRAAIATAISRIASLRGASAQGSEAGFGVPFVGGVNPGAVVGARLVQIASCNTHATATLLAALGGPSLAGLEETDLVCVRRCEDLGGRERLVGASVVSRHRDATHGTHHAADAATVFATLGLAPAVPARTSRHPAS